MQEITMSKDAGADMSLSNKSGGIYSLLSVCSMLSLSPTIWALYTCVSLRKSKKVREMHKTIYRTVCPWCESSAAGTEAA